MTSWRLVEAKSHTTVKRLQIQGLFCCAHYGCAVLWRLTSDLFAVNLFIRRDLLSKVGRYVARFQILEQKERSKALISSFLSIQKLIFLSWNCWVTWIQRLPQKWFGPIVIKCSGAKFAAYLSLSRAKR